MMQSAIVDKQKLASELIRAVRGHRSQPWVARRLGYASNAVYAWESGRRFPSSSVFLRMAHVCRVDVLAALSQLAPERSSPCAIPESDQQVSEWLNALAGGLTRVALAMRTGTDRTTVARWLTGNTQPRLPELLTFIEATTHRLLDFVRAFADPSQLPSVRKVYADLLAQQVLAYDKPASHSVLRALELEGYRALPRHDSAWLAAAIGIDRVEVEALLSELRAARQIYRRGGRYQVARVMTVDTRVDPEKNRGLKTHWARVALQRLEAGKLSEDTLFSYNLFAVSRDKLREIRRLHVEYFERVRSLVESSEQAEHVVLMNLQLLPLALPEKDVAKSKPKTRTP